MARKPDKPLVWLKSEVKTPPFSEDARIQDWRIVYRVASDAVVVLEVFSKKTDSTPTVVLATCRPRLAAYLKVVSPRERRR